MNKTIKSRFDADDTQRHGILNHIRAMVALTKPWILPPQGQTADQPLPENYQSVGSRGSSAIEGKMLLSLYTPGTPWFKHTLPASILYANDVPDDTKRILQQKLLMRDLAIVSLLESQKLDKSRGAITSFRSRKRIALAQAIHTGDSLERMDDDYRITTFRRDQYVTRRDTAGDVLYHVTCEEIDPLGLDDELLMLADIDKSDLMEKDVAERIERLYTQVEWNPQTKVWVITQEVNEHIINESQEKITPFFSTAVELSPGEHYGRGIVEQNYGDLKSLDEMERRRLELLEAATYNKVAKDYSCQTHDDDLKKNRTGNILRAKVQNGAVQDIGMLSFPQVREFNMITAGIQDKTRQIGQALLLETAVQPQGERVTAEMVRRIANELDSSLGGAYAPIAEQQQVPSLRRAVYLAEKQNILPKLPDGIEIQAITGIAALARNIELQKGLQVAQIFAQMPPEAQQRLDWGIMAETLANLADFYQPGVIKSEERLRAEARDRQRQDIANKAHTQAIQSAGAIAETAAMQATAQ